MRARARAICVEGGRARAPPAPARAAPAARACCCGAHWTAAGGALPRRRAVVGPRSHPAIHATRLTRRALVQDMPGRAAACSPDACQASRVQAARHAGASTATAPRMTLAPTSSGAPITIFHSARERASSVVSSARPSCQDCSVRPPARARRPLWSAAVRSCGPSCDWACIRSAPQPSAGSVRPAPGWIADVLDALRPGHARPHALSPACRGTLAARERPSRRGSRCHRMGGPRTHARRPARLVVLLHEGAGVEEEELRAAAAQAQLVAALQVPPRVRRHQRRVQLRAGGRA